MAEEPQQLKHDIEGTRSQLSADLDALTALVRAELGEDSVPRTITVVPGVPMAATGKPDKRALLAMHGMPPHASPLSGPG